MSIMTLRPAIPTDASECGRILHAAFASSADHHNFPREFPSLEDATREATTLTEHPDFHGLVAERDGRTLGSAFVELRSPIAGIGPVTVDPTEQNRGVGRELMKGVMDHAVKVGVAGIRLSQAAYNNRSFCLYTRLGFRVRAQLSMLQGSPLAVRFPGYEVRAATPADIEECNLLCHSVHGFHRGRELADAVSRNAATVLAHLGKITGYATGIDFFSHAVARSDQDLMALIGAASGFPGPGFLVPTRNYEVLSWSLGSGLRLVMQASLMTIGLYNEPQGAWLPSSQY